MLIQRRYITFGAAILMAATLTTTGCKSLMKKYAPEVRLVDAKLAGLNLEGADVDFTYEMKNKAPIEVTFSRLAYKLKVDGNRLIEADNKKDVKIQSKGTSQFVITHRVIFQEFAQSLIDLYKKDQVTVRIEGVVGVRIPKLNDSVEVPIEAEKVVTIPKLPSISFSAFKYKKANLNPFKPTATFELKFKVKNPNKFNIDIARLNYGFVAANERIIDGDKSAIALPPNKEQEMSIPVNLRGKKIINLVPKLRDLNSTSFKLSGEMQMKIGPQTLKLPYAVP